VHENRQKKRLEPSLYGFNLHTHGLAHIHYLPTKKTKQDYHRNCKNLKYRCKKVVSAYKSYAHAANKQLSKTSQPYLNKEEFPPLSRDQELENQSAVKTVVKSLIQEIAKNPRI